MNLDRRRVRAIARKEVREYRRNRSLVTGMAIIPLVFLVQPLVSVFAVPAAGAVALSHRHELVYLLGIPALVSPTPCTACSSRSWPSSPTQASRTP